MNNINKRAVENFIVAKASTSLKTSGTINNASTGNVNLVDGQIGFATTTPYGTTAKHTFLPTSMTIDTAPFIALYQGNENSADIAGGVAAAKHPLAARPYEVSGEINGKTNVLVTRQNFRDPQYSLWSIGDVAANTATQINTEDLTEYAVTVAYRGRRHDEQYGYQQSAVTTFSVTTPDFTNTAAITQPVDWIVENLGYQINRVSKLLNIPGRFSAKDPIIALAVGEASGTEIAAITVGDSVTVMSTAAGNHNITITQAMLDTLTAASAASGFTHIHDIDLTTAGTTTGGTSLGLWIIGLDDNTAFVDYIPQKKTRIKVGLTRGFVNEPTTIRFSEDSKADEGEGLGATLNLWYKATQGQRKYNLRHTMDPVIEYPSPISDATEYVTFVIHHGKTEQVDTASVVQSSYREIVLIPSTETTLLSNFTTAMNTWLASGDNQAIVTL